MAADESTSRPGIVPNETVVPLLPCVDADATLAFWKSLGFAVTYEQYKPYLYLALHYSGFDLNYGKASPTLDPAVENSGGCLVFVDDVAAYHATFVAAMRAAYGKVLGQGLPRITRYRSGASRFTLSDPNGNSVIVIQRDEPLELEYGGSSELTGLARVIDNARILREFKNDDRQASRALRSGLKRHAEGASAGEVAVALAMLIELFTALEQPDAVAEHGARLQELRLSQADRDRALTVVAEPSLLSAWLPPAGSLRRP